MRNTSSMNLGKPSNPNYAAVRVVLKEFQAIPGADRIQVAKIFSNNVIVSIDARTGDEMIFFPVGCQLSEAFVANNNLYRKPEMGNVDKEAKGGFFDEKRRVTALKMRGVKSEGFACPVSFLSYLGIDTEEIPLMTDFDSVNDHEICRKYVSRCNPPSTKAHDKKARQSRPGDRIQEGQFRFHYDTENLRRNIFQIMPNDRISLSWKLHGSSGIFSNLLIQKDLKWYEKVLQWLGVPVQNSDYGLIYSSRKVVKGVGEVESGKQLKSVNQHYYDSDIWKVEFDKIKDRIPKGFTIYGEIVGYTPTGSWIQRDYDYGCKPGESKLYVYRVTVTNADGKVIEMPYDQMRDWCSDNGIEPVPHIFSGYAGHVTKFETGIEPMDRFQSKLLQYLEESYVHDQDSIFCSNKVPEEGIVLRVDRGTSCKAMKLKAFRFLGYEQEVLDSGGEDLEE